VFARATDDVGFGATVLLEQMMTVVPSGNACRITHLRVAPDGQHIAAGYGRGSLVVLNMETAKKVVQVLAHGQWCVCALKWAGPATLFSGDESGRVICTQLRGGVPAVTTVCSLGNPIVQLQWRAGNLLVSTTAAVHRVHIATKACKQVCSVSIPDLMLASHLWRCIIDGVAMCV